MRDENMIAALKRERAGYAAAGRTDRVAQVDEQIKAFGGEVPEAEEPEGRQAPPKSTAEAAPKPTARRKP